MTTVFEDVRCPTTMRGAGRDGLRLALAIMAAEEETWFALLGKSRSWRINLVREVRHKTLQVARKRVQTASNRHLPKNAATMNDELA